MDEFSLINGFLKPIALKDSLNDDAFLLDTSNQMVVTKDVLVEGVHFLHFTNSNLVAKKALRVNLSDISSTGASPMHYMLGLILNRKNNDEWYQDLCHGFECDAKEFNISLIGGDTVFYDGVNIISVTMFGSLKNNHYPLVRSGAKTKELVCVTGTIGDAALGLMIYNQTLNMESAFLKSRYDLPIPRIKLGQLISDLASSCIDISDGLLQDAKHICKESNIGMIINLDSIPLSPDAILALSNDKNLLNNVLAGGDDYELLFTISEERYLMLKKFLRTDEVAISIIGKTIDGNQVVVIDKNGIEQYFDKKGFIHK